MDESKKGESGHTRILENRGLGIYIRSRSGTHVTGFPYDAEESGSLGVSLPDAGFAEFSPTGDHIVTIEDSNGAAVIRTGDGDKIVASCGGTDDAETPLRNNIATFSPRGTYLLTWARPVSGVSVPNLVIYRVESGERLAAFHQKTFHKDAWPTIQWSDDENMAARGVTNTVHFFKGDRLDEPPVAKLGIPGVSTFALSRGPGPYNIAALIGGSNGAPGRLAMFKHPDDGGEQISTRSTYRADTANFKWSPKGTAVLAQVSTSVDSTGKSYYGQTEVFFLDTKGVEKRVDLPKEGPCYDAAWSPTGNEFIIVYGYMPSRATMFDEKCDPIYDFGTGPRNLISFSPHGRFVALAGFGNVAGSTEFWDKNKRKLVGKTELPCTILHSWSPCSRYFLSAVTSPRMRVDNGLRVVRFDGQLIHEHKFDGPGLYQAMFRPALRGTYPDPKLTMDDMIGGPVVNVEEQSNGTAGTKSGVYRPPGSRGAPSFKLNEHVKAGAVDKANFLTSSVASNANVVSSSVAPSKRFVPGMDPDLLNVPVKGQSKSANARRKKKNKSGAASAGSAGKSDNDPTKADGAKMADEKDEVDEEAGETFEAVEKKVKKLRKKLRAIEALKESQSAGKSLDAAQLEKLAAASSAAEELHVAEMKMAELSLNSDPLST